MRRVLDQARLIRKITLCLVLVALASACSLVGSPDSQMSSTFGDAAPVARPPFVRVEGGPGASLLVMGTVHLGPDEGWEFSPEIMQGLQEADAFAMEIDLRNLDENSLGDRLAELVILPVGTTLGDVVSPETAKLLLQNEPLLARLGLPAMARDRFKPWYLAMSLVQVAVGDTRYSLERSAEEVVLREIGERPLIGLETLEGQLSMLNDLSPQLQDAMLRDTLGRIDETLAEMDRLVRAWEIADRETLSEIAKQGVDELPDLEAFYEILLTDRNARWVAELSRRIDDPRFAGTTLFVAVGALHLVGDEGVPEMMRSRGYRVDRIH